MVCSSISSWVGCDWCRGKSRSLHFFTVVSKSRHPRRQRRCLECPSHVSEVIILEERVTRPQDPSAASRRFQSQPLSIRFAVRRKSELLVLSTWIPFSSSAMSPVRPSKFCLGNLNLTFCCEVNHQTELVTRNANDEVSHRSTPHRPTLKSSVEMRKLPEYLAACSLRRTDP